MTGRERYWRNREKHARWRIAYNADGSPAYVYHVGMYVLRSKRRGKRRY